MAFDAFGDVRACYRSLYTYGRVGTDSLREMWDGATRSALVDALDRSDLSLGCSHCEWQRRTGTEHLAFARRYDDLAIVPGATWPQQMEFALSNTCNLQCVQCMGQFSSAIRSQREGLPPLPQMYGDDFFDQLGPFLHHLEVARFTGGEPFLSRSTQRVWDLLLASDNRPSCSLVTNATQWNDRAEEMIERLRFQVTVSLDAVDPAVLAETRVGIDPAAVMANIERYREATRRTGTVMCLSYCMMTTNWQEFGAVLRYADDRDIVVDCSVVTDPQNLSLHRLGREALAEVVESLEREDRTLRPALRTNAQLWVTELERLRATLDDPDRSGSLEFTDIENRRFRQQHQERAVAVPETPMNMLFVKPARRSRAAPPDPPGSALHDDGPNADEEAAVVLLLRTWARDPFAHVDRGRIDDDILTALEAAPPGHWLESGDLVGHPVERSRDRIIDLIGTSGQPTVLERTEDRLDQVAIHTLGDCRTELRAILIRRPTTGTGVVTIDSWMVRRSLLG